MQEVVPSQVVAATLKFFPKASEPDTLTLRSNHLPVLVAIVRLIRRVPPELFTIPVEQYVELEQAIEIIEQSNRRLAREVGLFQISSAHDSKSVVQVIYSALSACHDSP